MHSITKFRLVSLFLIPTLLLQRASSINPLVDSYTFDRRASVTPMFSNPMFLQQDPSSSSSSSSSSASATATNFSHADFMSHERPDSMYVQENGFDFYSTVSQGPVAGSSSNRGSTMGTMHEEYQDMEFLSDNMNSMYSTPTLKSNRKSQSSISSETETDGNVTYATPTLKPANRGYVNASAVAMAASASSSLSSSSTAIAAAQAGGDYAAPHYGSSVDVASAAKKDATLYSAIARSDLDGW